MNNTYKNIEKNNRCFIVGTGTSISSQDLTLLKNEVVLGVSGLYMHKDIKIFSPKYFILPSVMKHKNFNSVKNYIKWLKEMDKALSDDTIMFLCKSDKPYIEKSNLFSSKDIVYKSYVKYDENKSMSAIEINKMPNIWSVSESAIQIALYLGFKDIFLLGFDHDWFNGSLVHFNGNEYMKHSINNELNIRKKHGFDSELQMNRHAYIFNKYKKLYGLKENIYNTNSNASTYVDTFPYVEYSDLFKNKDKEILSKAKENFIKVPSRKRNESILLSASIGTIYNKVISLEGNDYIIYGNGSTSKIIKALIPDKIKATVDLNSTQIASEESIRKDVKGTIYSPKILKKISYNKIIISLIGREEIIIDYLKNDLHINKEKMLFLL